MTKWQQRADWVGSQVEDQYVMINIESGRYMALNDTATEAWRLLATPQDAEALTVALMDKFDVDRATCERSVATLLDTMSKSELVQAVN